MTVSQLTVEIVPNDQLPTALPGWQALGCGLQAMGAGAPGQIAGFFTRGVTLCLAQPDDNASPGPWRLAYFDVRPGIGRWVFIPIQNSAGQLCSDRFHQPATFALLMRAS